MHFFPLKNKFLHSLSKLTFSLSNTTSQISVGNCLMNCLMKHKQVMKEIEANFVLQKFVLNCNLRCDQTTDLYCESRLDKNLWAVLAVLLLNSRGQFVEQKLMLSSNFRCDQIHYSHWYDLSHTLLCYLSQT
jgi:hypothetical protein